MAVLPIRFVPEAVLRQKARPVERIDMILLRLLEDMIETMYEARGIGLAAPQVGISKRVIVVDIGDGPICLINPKLDEMEGEEIGPEGCLSIPGVQGEVKRAAKLVARGVDEQGRKVRIPAEGLLARVFQHEVDHLDGRLFTDLASDIRDGTRQGQEEEEEEEVEA